MVFKLNPPKEILEKLEIFNFESFGQGNEIFKRELLFQPTKKMSGPLELEILQVTKKMYKFYKDVFGFEINSSFYVSREMLRNAIYHGPQDKEIFLGIYGNLTWKVFACNDGGDYFKKDYVKKDWESKIREKNPHTLSLENHNYSQFGKRLGQQMMFGSNVFVDINQGTLYLSQLTKISE